MLVFKVYYACIKSLLEFCFKEFMMNEPSLESMSDYNTVDKEKRKILLIIAFSAIIIGTIYTFIATQYGEVEDAIAVQKSIQVIPIR